MTGTVSLVGAGPGDPDLLTVKARRLLDGADAVLHDSLVGDRIVASLPGAAAVLNVGKTPDGERTPQAEINRLMVERARDGDAVVRLKGGDPTVFGRGGEEAEHLADAGVPFEIVPGIASPLASGVAGIPLTHREHASSVTVVTGHEDPTKDESALDWGALADTVGTGGTLCILMGVGHLPDNVAALREQGLPAGTPAAMLERATLDEERVVTGTLGSIVGAVEDAGIEPPAITLVGDVVAVRDRVAAWLDRAEDAAIDGGGAAVVPPLGPEVGNRP